MKNLKKIINILQHEEKFLQEKFYVKEIKLFGSYVRGEATDKSDLDILVDFKKPISLFTFLDLEEYLESCLGIKVDLVSKKALRPGIGKYIIEEAISL